MCEPCDLCQVKSPLSELDGERLCDMCAQLADKPTHQEWKDANHGKNEKTLAR